MTLRLPAGRQLAGAAEPRPGSLPAVPLRGQWTRVGLLVDLRCAELANALGLSWRLSSLKRMIVLAAAALSIAVPAAGYGFARIFAALSTDVPAPALLVPLAASLILLSGLGLFFAEALGRYRNAVSGHPNRAYFRALDVPASLVHLVYVVPRVLGATGFWVLLGAGAIAGLLAASTDRAWVPAAIATMVLQPFLWLAGTLLVSLRQAGNVLGAGVRFGAGVAAAAAMGASSGLVYALVLVPRLPVGGATEPVSPVVPGQEHGTSLAMALVATLLGLAVLCRIEWRRLRFRSFRVETAASPSRQPRLGRSAGWYWFRLLLSQRGRSWRRRVEDRIGWALAGVVSALAAARAAGAPDLAALGGLSDAAAANFFLAAAFGSAMLGLTGAEMTLGDLGRRACGGRLRAAVETGAPLRTAVAVHLATLLAPTMLLGALASAAASLVLARLELFPLVIAAGACAGTIIAERLFPPPRTVDGGAGESLATAMAALILGGIPPMWLLSAPALSMWLTPLSAAALLGGALWCAHRNLTVL